MAIGAICMEVPEQVSEPPAHYMIPTVDNPDCQRYAVATPAIKRGGYGACGKQREEWGGSGTKQPFGVIQSQWWCVAQQ
eukprot:scaffold62447_cov32-Attheya_sp.AAC.1